MRLCFPVKNCFSGVIMNIHLKLKTVNGIRWGMSVQCTLGRGLSRVPKKSKSCQFYTPKYWALSILISDCCLMKFGCGFYMVYLRPHISAIITPIGGRWLYWGGGSPTPTRGIGNCNTAVCAWQSWGLNTLSSCRTFYWFPCHSSFFLPRDAM